MIFNVERRSIRLTVVGGLALFMFLALAVLRYYMHGRDIGAAVVYAGCVVGVWAALYGWVALLGWWLPRWSVRKAGPLADVAASEMGTLYFASGTIGLAVWTIYALMKALGQSSTGSDVFQIVFAVGLFFPLVLEVGAATPLGVLRCLLLVPLEGLGAVAVLTVRIAATRPLWLAAGTALAVLLMVGGAYGILRVAASFARDRAGCTQAKSTPGS